MWINLFDSAESSGFGVRNLRVWDKMSIGMGVGWRTQHELVLFGVKSKVKFDNHKAMSNVIQAKRTGNPLHPTQKPVELIEKIINVSDWAKVFMDPFAGSGTTLIACEKAGAACYAMELDEKYCDIIIKRWEEYTGKKAELLGGVNDGGSKKRTQKNTDGTKKATGKSGTEKAGPKRSQAKTGRAGNAGLAGSGSKKRVEADGTNVRKAGAVN